MWHPISKSENMKNTKKKTLHDLVGGLGGGGRFYKNLFFFVDFSVVD